MFWNSLVKGLLRPKNKLLFKCRYVSELKKSGYLSQKIMSNVPKSCLKAEVFYNAKYLT